MVKSLKLNQTNENIKEILHNLFYDIMNVEFNLWLGFVIWLSMVISFYT